jgi:hypothetical protein
VRFREREGGLDLVMVMEVGGEFGFLPFSYSVLVPTTLLV